MHCLLQDEWLPAAHGDPLHAAYLRLCGLPYTVSASWGREARRQDVWLATANGTTRHGTCTCQG